MRDAGGEGAGGGHALGDDETLAHARLLGAKRHFPDLALDGERQARQISLENVVMRARLHRGDGPRFADRSRDENERDVLSAGVEIGERPQPAVRGKRIVGDDDVPFPRRERPPELLLGLDAGARGLEPASSQLVLDERRVVVGVLDAGERGAAGS